LFRIFHRSSPRTLVLAKVRRGAALPGWAVLGQGGAVPETIPHYSEVGTARRGVAIPASGISAGTVRIGLAVIRRRPFQEVNQGSVKTTLPWPRTLSPPSPPASCAAFST